MNKKWVIYCPNIGEHLILKRTMYIIILAMVMSFVQGFYIIQLFAKPMLENSGIIDNIAQKVQQKHYSIDALTNIKTNQKDKTLSTFKYIEKFKSSFGGVIFLKLFGHQSWHIKYIWSILLSQFIVSIFIGVVLQFLWEDRPITEPL